MVDAVLSRPADADSDSDDEIASEFRDWMKGLRLTRFTKASMDHGYDDLRYICTLDEEEVNQWANNVGMKDGHRGKLSRAVRQLQTSRSTRR